MVSLTGEWQQESLLEIPASKQKKVGVSTGALATILTQSVGEQESGSMPGFNGELGSAIEVLVPDILGGGQGLKAKPGVMLVNTTWLAVKSLRFCAWK
jgi:hypothetical protein